MANWSVAFWFSLAQIIGVNIVLSADNALVIALAARPLPSAQRLSALIYGTVAAVVARIVLTLCAARLIKLPWISLVGGGLLYVIAIQLMQPQKATRTGARTDEPMLVAIRTMLIADLVMSLDNVVAVAAAAKSNLLLLSLGLAISIPLVTISGTLIIKLIDRFPFLHTLGAALIGWIASDAVLDDPAVVGWMGSAPEWLRIAAAIGTAISVMLLGHLFRTLKVRRNLRHAI